jgi:hypothetical protein
MKDYPSFLLVDISHAISASYAASLCASCCGVPTSRSEDRTNLDRFYIGYVNSRVRFPNTVSSRLVPRPYLSSDLERGFARLQTTASCGSDLTANK